MKNKVWGTNKDGIVIKEQDKLECGSGNDKWITHVLWDAETAKWHREQDYYAGKLIGRYTG